jgi:MarR family 2-MHQ and catechol resistance regulon transcriptional repressor
MQAQNLARQELTQRAIEKFWESFPYVWHSVRARVDKMADDNHGLTMQQFAVLRGIYNGRDSVSELAQKRNISRPAISRAVDNLVNKGYVGRFPTPHDRRYVHLALTEKGQKLLESQKASIQFWMTSKLAALSDDQLLAIISSLDLLYITFEEQS